MDFVYSALLSFVLVTLIGGTFGAWLQQRTWHHRQLNEKRTRQRDAALEVFETVSSIMDRRLFRLNQLRLWIERDDDERFQFALAEYRCVLADWDGNINQLLAKQQIYLGQENREQFDYGVGKKFVEAGAAVEALFQQREKGTSISDTSEVKVHIKELRAEVYDFNLRILEKIEGS